MAKASDTLAWMARGNVSTHHSIDFDVTNVTGPSGYLINVRHGSTVDKHAMTTAPSEEQLDGAGLDVFENEPNIPDALTPLPNIALLSKSEARQAIRTARCGIWSLNIWWLTKMGVP